MRKKITLKCVFIQKTALVFKNYAYLLNYNLKLCKGVRKLYKSAKTESCSQ